MDKPYEVIEHTADIGLKVYGADPAALFQNAADALTGVITDPQSLSGTKMLDLTVTGVDWPDLMVNWLRELLYLWSGRQLLVASARIEHIRTDRVDAAVSVEPYRSERHRIHNEIKAVTYHQIDVSERLTGWEATVILDV